MKTLDGIAFTEQERSLLIVAIAMTGGVAGAVPNAENLPFFTRPFAQRALRSARAHLTTTGKTIARDALRKIEGAK